MIRSLPAAPTYSAPQPTRSTACQECQEGMQPESDPVFDLTTLDNAREIYFLPQVDRLAAFLAAKSEKPLQVRFEAENQFIEYTLTKDPKATVQASINGTPYEVSSQPAQDGSLALIGHSAAGDFDGNYYTLEQGDQVTALVGPNRMPINHSLEALANPGVGDPLFESRGNFACARMTNSYFPEGDKLHLMGNLGMHTVDAFLTQAEDKSWLLQGEFGDIKFRQTFTPISAAG